MNIIAIQLDIFWEDPEKNKSALEKILVNCKNYDLIILPEMFTTGFSMNPIKIAEPHLGISCLWMQQQAKKCNTTLIGSIPIFENGKYYNRLYVASKDDIPYYDKRHLFSMADENIHYYPGNKDLIITIKGWKIKPLICYDLRFPVWSRNRYKNGTYDYDIMIFIANWPKVRVNAWIELLKARAIENLSHVVGVNRIGQDGNGVQYNGCSRVFNFKGERMDDFIENEFRIQKIQFEKEELTHFRNNFPALKDADEFNLKIENPR